MKLSCSAFQAGSSYAQKILSGHMQNYGATSSTAATSNTGESTHGLLMPTWKVEEIEGKGSPNENAESDTEGGSSATLHGFQRLHGLLENVRSGGHEGGSRHTSSSSHSDIQPDRTSESTKTRDSSRSPSESPAHRTKSNQRWMKLRTTVQLSGAISSTIQKKPPLKREDSFLKRFSTRQQVPETQETFEIGDEEDGVGGGGKGQKKKRRRNKLPRTVVNPDGSFFFYWLMILTFCVLYNLWTLIVRQSFPELQEEVKIFWYAADAFCDLVFLSDIAVQFRTGYLEQGLMVYKTKKLAKHYVGSKPFFFDIFSLLPTDLFQLYFGSNPLFRFPRFLKVYRIYNYYYMVESRTVFPNVWRVVNLIHILLLLAHWFGCFYYLLSEAEGFRGPWVYPDPEENDDFAPLTRKYLGSLYWSTLTLTTIGDLPTPYSNWQYLFTIVSYLIGVFIFATIVGQVGNVITNRNANRLEFERLLDGAKMYMRHHKVPRDMQRRVLRWYDYSWSRGRIQGGGDINTALGLLPDKLKTELALHVNLSVLRKVTIFQECQPEFLHDLVLKMKAYIFTPGDLICRKGEVAREMFIIADGILEVISDAGKVLTTMQAGDFFGEIGILNLDGLNKRTADVRSVGYSELFSLSREDVLAAMKDYPEAQEILQTLGRKRLMEARKANAPPPKKELPGVVPPQKGSPLLVGLKGSETPESDTTGKRIVEKLRSDVKGLRNAIRRSRKSNSSKEDSSEPESGKDKESGSGRSRKESSGSDRKGRGVLKRMHHVISDEKEREPSTTPSTSTSSPLPVPKKVIGAGLPLMQRLRLLKQKEDKEKAEVTSVKIQTTTVLVESRPKSLPSDGPPSSVHFTLPVPEVVEEEKEEPAVSIQKDPLVSGPSSSTRRPSILDIKNKNGKAYGSVDDLSPEFSRLPFIKKLQILNERQKIAQLLKSKNSNAVLTRSTSEGSSEPNLPPPDDELHSMAKGRRTQSSSEQFLIPDLSGEDESEVKWADPTPPHSPESNDNETAERRNLKSILKRLNQNIPLISSPLGSPASQVGRAEEAKLLRAPTVEGYAARHRKYAKNVTFQRQAVKAISPDSPQQLTSDKRPESPLFDPRNEERQRTTITYKTRDVEMSETFALNMGLGSIQDEYIGGVFLGIKNIMQSKMVELQNKFQDKYEILEEKLREREEIISVLHRRIIELETGVEGEELRPNEIRRRRMRTHSLHSNGDSDSDVEDDDDEEEEHFFRRPYHAGSSYLFSRGDSIDTVISNQDTIDDEVFASLNVELRPERQIESPPGPQIHPLSLSNLDQRNEGSIERENLTEGERPLWEFEFHCEEFGNARRRRSAQTSTPQGPSGERPGEVRVESVALDIESSSEEESEQERVKPQPLKETSSESGESDSTDGDDLDNKNWEVKLLAKEMHRIEEETDRANDEEVKKMVTLSNQISNLTSVVNEGALSPNELDMLESVLANKSKKVRSLCKAFSVESEASTSATAVRRGRRSFDTRIEVKSPTEPGSSLGTKKLSPGERLELQRLSCERKFPSTMRRQTSLRESHGQEMMRLGELGQIEGGGRRKSTAEPKSFLNRFNFLRQLTTKSKEEDSTTSVATTSSMATTSFSTNASVKSESAPRRNSVGGLLPSFISSALFSREEEIDGGGTEAGIYTLPLPGPSGSPSEQPKSSGENQPLLKK